MKLVTLSPAFALFFALGCSSPVEDGAEQAQDKAAIGTATTDASSARDYPFGVRVDMLTPQGTSGCTGAIIAPRVVLTASHCLSAHLSKGVTIRHVVLWAPYAPHDLAKNPQKIEEYRIVMASTSDDWFARPEVNGVVQTGIVPGPGPNFVDLKQRDVALIFLPEGKAFSLDSYPTRAIQRLPPNANGFVLGRRAHGELTKNKFIVRSDVSAIHDVTLARPFHYETRAYAEPGDSGGPLILDGTSRILGVNSGSLSMGTTYVARIDDLACWIASNVSRHGGEGPQGASGIKPTLDYYCPNGELE